MDPKFIVLGTTAITILFMAIALVLVFRKKMGASGARGLLRKGPKGAGETGGVSYEYFTGSGGKNSPPYLTVKIPCQTLRFFRLTRENRIDRFFKNLGLAVEMRTMDGRFDERFYIHTNHTGFVRDLFRHREARDGAMEIHDLGFQTIACDGKHLTATWSPYQPKEEVDPKVFEEVASRLVSITRVEVRASGADTDGPASWRLRRVAAFAVPIGLDSIGVLALVFGFMNYRPLDPGRTILLSLGYSIPAAILFLWIAVVLLRGRSGSHREWIIASTLALFAFPIAGAGGTVFLNGRLDRSASTVHESRVLHKYETRDKNGAHYHVVLESWRGREGEKMGVGRNVYDKTEPLRSTFAVTTRRGRFGREWVVDNALVEGE